MVRAFENEDFLCPCGNCLYSTVDGYCMDKTLVQQLNILQLSLPVPIVVISGIRCRDYDNQLTHSDKLSQHAVGEAVDITTYRGYLDKLFDLCVENPHFTYIQRFHNFIHVERSNKKRYVRVKDSRQQKQQKEDI